jgi:hypothetical protein
MSLGPEAIVKLTRSFFVAPLALVLALAGCDRKPPPSPTCEKEPAVAAAALPPPPPAPPAAAPASPAAPVVATPAAKTDASKPSQGDAIEATAKATQLRVRRIVVAEGVEGREPVGARSELRAGELDKVFAFVEVENAERLPGEVFVSFVPPEGPEIGNVRLSVGGAPRWRTWAFSRAVRAPGPWTALVRDAEGNVIAREPFTVTL